MELNRLDEIHALQKVASFATLVATYEKGGFVGSPSRIPYMARLTRHGPAGFLLILEPFETDNATVPNPIFHLT